MRLLARFLPFFFFFAFSEPQFLQQKNKRVSGSSVGAIPALTRQAVSISLPPTSPCSLPFFHLSIIYSFSRPLFIEYLLYCRCRKHNRHIQTGVQHCQPVCWKRVCSNPSLSSLSPINPAGYFVFGTGKKKKKMCQEFISVHLCVAVYTHTFIFNICSSVVMGTIFWCLWA